MPGRGNGDAQVAQRLLESQLNRFLACDRARNQAKRNLDRHQPFAESFRQTVAHYLRYARTREQPRRGNVVSRDPERFVGNPE